MSLEKKVAVITGCSSGIGYETALMFARNGFITYATMRNPGKGDGIRSISEKENLSIKIIKLDVDEDKSVKDAITTIFLEFGQLDILINNAGCVYLGALEDLSIEEIKSQFETNFFGTIRVIQAVLPIMRKQKSGTIVNLSSIGGRFGYPNCSAYASSKFAIEGLTESLYYEIEPLGIKLILIEPGITNTNIFHSANISKKSNNPDSPYFKEMHRWTNKFTKLIENGSSPNLVAKTILNAVSNNNSRLRYPVGIDAEQALEKRKNMSDDEFFNEIKNTGI